MATTRPPSGPAAALRTVIAIAAVLLAGCGSVVVDRGRSATPHYDGALDAGAAVGALEGAAATRDVQRTA